MKFEKKLYSNQLTARGQYISLQFKHYILSNRFRSFIDNHHGDFNELSHGNDLRKIETYERCNVSIFEVSHCNCALNLL
jgi:hypothetical protein